MTRRSMSTTIFTGLLLLAPALACAVWGILESRAAHAAGHRVYDNPFPTLGLYLFGWPGFLVLGVGLLRGSTRMAKVAGLLCLLIAATPVAMFFWQH